VLNPPFNNISIILWAITFIWWRRGTWRNPPTPLSIL